jgi:hypothetical protein
MELITNAARCTGMYAHRQQGAMDWLEAIDCPQCRHGAVVSGANVPAVALALTSGGRCDD